MRFKYLIVSAVALTIIAHNSNAQCFDKIDPAAVSTTYQIDRSGTTQAKAHREEFGELKVTGLRALLDKNQRLKIALETELSSDFHRAGDIVMFTVLEDIFGDGSVTVDPTVEEEAAKFRGISEQKRCVVIKKGAPVFGVIDYTRGRYPFYIGGKAKLFVFLTSVELVDGQKLPLEFALPIEAANSKTNLTECKKNRGRQCITGRRQKPAFPTQVIGAGAETGIALIDDDTNDVIAGLALLAALSKISGVQELITPPAAGFKPKMMFEAQTGNTQPQPVWINLAAPKKEEKDK